jgi:hypothetical protein
MALREHMRLRLTQVEDNIAAARSLEQMPGYAPANPECSIEQVAVLVAAVEEAQMAEIHAANLAMLARNRVIAAEWALHNRMIAVKHQVRAQYGVNADEVEMVGLKRASTRKLPGRRNGKVAGGNGSSQEGVNGGA